MSSNIRIVVVDGVPRREHVVAEQLRAAGYNVTEVANADRAIGYADEQVRVVLCPYDLDGIDGPAFIRLWKRRNPSSRFVVLDEIPSIERAKEVLRAGAADYLPRSGDPAVIVGAVQRLEATEALPSHNVFNTPLERIIGEAPPMRELRTRLTRAALFDSPVLIAGASGTGKSLVAEVLHAISPRREAPFHVLSCGIELTQPRVDELLSDPRGGTIMLDDVAEADVGAQARLLLLLRRMESNSREGEPGKQPLRVLAATNRELHAMMEAGEFRGDLLHRLSVIEIRLPPLRDRAGDIPVLCDRFMHRINGAIRGHVQIISETALDCLRRYAWPGNVRELRNTLEGAMVLAPGAILNVADLPANIRSSNDGLSAWDRSPNAQTTRHATEVSEIVGALERCNGNRTHAARQLGISVRTLQRKIHEFDLADRWPPADGIRRE